MKFLLTATIPHEPFNTLVRQNKAGEILNRILAEIKPEVAYFTELDGTRAGVFIVDIPEASRIPSIAEPFFLNFNADCRFRMVMSPEELGRAGLDTLGSKWS